MKKRTMQVAANKYGGLLPKEIWTDLNHKINDDTYSQEDFIKEYGPYFEFLHQQEVRSRLSSIRGMLVFFVVLTILSLIVALIGGLGAAALVL